MSDLHRKISSPSLDTICQVISLGRMNYLDTWALQKRLAAARGADEIPDTLLFVEHPPTYTLGSSGHEEYILWSEAERAARGIEVHKVDRGGDVTYHGPGQLVGYPIIKLAHGDAANNLHTDVISYVRGLEQTLILALASYGIAAWPYAGLTGVWVGNETEKQDAAKIAAIGVKVTTRRVTFHGFALNVTTDMDYFRGIVPCGIADKPVTSMASVLHRSNESFHLEQVAERVRAAFAQVFNRELSLSDVSILTAYWPEKVYFPTC